MQEPWNLKQQFSEAVKQNNGWVNCHAHFDKAFYITKDGLEKSMKLKMEEKWLISDDIKRRSTEEQIAERIRIALNIMVAQGARATMSFVDAYEAVGHKAIDAANRVKAEYKNKIIFLTATQPLGGLLTPEALKLYEEITAKADIAGGLPSKDRPQQDKNLDALFSVAKNLHKPVHVHIDQLNQPDELDTEKLIAATIRHNYEGKVTAVHVISVSAQPKQYRTEIYKKLAAAGISVVVCPSAGLSMKQPDEYLAPVHNSLANVSEMLEAGVLIGLGVDNIYDFYQPFIDGDLWTEMRLLQEACRYYNFDELVKIGTINGARILNL